MFRKESLVIRHFSRQTSRSFTGTITSFNVRAAQEHLGPNRAETAARLFKKTWGLFVKSLGEEGLFEKVAFRQAVERFVFVQ